MIVMFLVLKLYLGGHRFQDDREMETAVVGWLAAGDSFFYERRREIYIRRHDKLLTCGSAIRSELLWLMKVKKPQCLFWNYVPTDRVHFVCVRE